MIPLPRLRRPTLAEAALALLVVGLLLRGCHRPVNAPPRVVTHVDTVTAAAIAKQEPPAKPGVIHRIAHKPVQPERVQVAPGAGQELLAAVCDTAKRDTVTIQAVNDNHHSAPAFVYAENGSGIWTPWSGQTMNRFMVGPEGEKIVTFKVHGGYEARYSPELVIREHRFGWAKPLPFVAATFAAGWLAHSIATQF